MSGTVEDLDRRLRRRTVALVGALAFATIAATAGLAGVLLNGPAPPAAPPPAAGIPAGPAPEAVRAELAATGERIAGLEAVAAERAATVARLRAELADTRAEVGSLEEQLKISRRGVERLDAMLARATDRPAAGAAPKASVEAARTGSSSTSGAAGRETESGPSPARRTPAVARSGADGTPERGGGSAAKDAGGGEAEQPAPAPRGVAARDDGPGAAARDREARPRGAADGGGQRATSGPELEAAIGALRAALAGTKRRIETLEVPGARDEPEAVDPSTGPEAPLPGARPPGERSGTGRSGPERPD